MRKKIVILIPIVIAIITITMACIYFSKNEPKENTNMKFTEERAKELVNSSYIYYMLASGNVVETGEKLVLNEKEYYGIDINDDITSLGDIDKIIKDSFSEEIQYSLHKDIYGNNNKKFLYMNGKLYINEIKYNENCNMKDIDLNNYKTRKNKNYYLIDFAITKGNKIIGSEVKAKYENNKWVLTAPLKFCEDGMA